MTSIFSILCDTLNHYFDHCPGGLVSVANICKNKLFAFYGYKYGLRETIEQYLYTLGSKGNEYVSYSKKTKQVKLLKKITNKKLSDYK